MLWHYIAFSGSSDKDVWIKDLNLKQKDKENILKGRLLDDSIIRGAQIILKRMFPQQRGLRDPVVLEGMNRWDDLPKEFVQIMFDRTRSHWICVSNKMSDDNVVEIFDTAAPSPQVISACIQRQIATMVKSKEDHIKVRYV